MYIRGYAELSSIADGACMLRTVLVICASLLIGCASKDDRDYARTLQTQSRTTYNTPQSTDEAEKPITRRVISPSDPPVMFRPTVNLSIYHLRVPLGAVSGSDQFWKRVDEHAVDVTTYDVLYKNGIRVGKASYADLEFFLKILDRNPMQTLPTVFAASGAKTIELPMKKGALDQVL